jgi:hypothetical protein
MSKATYCSYTKQERTCLFAPVVVFAVVSLALAYLVATRPRPSPFLFVPMAGFIFAIPPRRETTQTPSMGQIKAPGLPEWTQPFGPSIISFVVGESMVER